MSLPMKSLVVGPIETNCYLIWDRATKEGAVIDPGADADEIMRSIAGSGMKPVIILLTHGHFDHVFCAGDIAREYGCEIACHKDDESQILGTMPVAEMYQDVSSFVPFTPTRWLEDGDSLALGETVVTVIHTPGHSPGGLTFAVDESLFCGDALFADGIGRSDFPGGSHRQLIESIHTRIFAYPDDTRVYPGHGPTTTVGREKRSNPYCRIV